MFENSLVNDLLTNFHNELLGTPGHNRRYASKIAIPEKFKFNVADDKGAIYSLNFYLEDDCASREHDIHYDYCLSIKSEKTGVEAHCKKLDIDWDNLRWEWKRGQEGDLPIREILKKCLTHLQVRENSGIVQADYNNIPKNPPL